MRDETTLSNQGSSQWALLVILYIWSWSSGLCILHSFQNDRGKKRLPVPSYSHVSELISHRQNVFKRDLSKYLCWFVLLSGVKQLDVI